MIIGTNYQITITKLESGIREENEWKQIHDNNSKFMKDNPEASQYGYVKTIKNYIDKTTILEQRVESVDVERILKAINKGL